MIRIDIDIIRWRLALKHRELSSRRRNTHLDVGDLSFGRGPGRSLVELECLDLLALHGAGAGVLPGAVPRGRIALSIQSRTCCAECVRVASCTPAHDDHQSDCLQKAVYADAHPPRRAWRAQIPRHAPSAQINTMMLTLSGSASGDGPVRGSGESGRAAWSQRRRWRAATMPSSLFHVQLAIVITHQV